MKEKAKTYASTLGKEGREKLQRSEILVERGNLTLTYTVVQGGNVEAKAKVKEAKAEEKTAGSDRKQ